MAAAMTALATTTLASTSATVTFSSIPAGYRDLRIICALNGTSNTYPWGVINSDAGANYNRVVMIGTGSATQSVATANQTTLDLGHLITGGVIAPYIFDFLDYAQTDKHKTILARMNNTSDTVVAGAYRWASTSAITSFSLNSSNTFAAGSTFSLFGVSA